MGKKSYTVTHSYAPDPDRRKVEAALALWAAALAESAMGRGKPHASNGVPPKGSEAQGT